MRRDRWLLVAVLSAACGGRVERDTPGEPSAGGTSAASERPSGGAPSSGGASSGGAGGTGDRDPNHPSGGAGGTFPSLGGAGGMAHDESCEDELVRFATSVVEHEFGPGQSHNQAAFPQAVFGPPRANDVSSVVSLGNGGFVVLAFGGSRIVDGPGPDFVVFENPLPGFVELATIAVSDDLVVWHEFPCTAQPDAIDHGSCAGVRPVYSSPSNGIDPLDPELAGGDWFDLADLGLASARFVRITDRADITGPSGVFDLDAVGVRHAACP